jgi:hypothetical protein
MGYQYPLVERREHLDEARRDLGDVPALRAVLDDYETALIEQENAARRAEEQPDGQQSALDRARELLRSVPAVQYGIVAFRPAGAEPG